MKVIVVGTGFSGLSSAYKLHKEGAEVVVLEARDRVGGRVYSKELSNGEIVEMGGEWINGDDLLYHELIDELGLTSTEVGIDFMVRQLMNGEQVSLGDCAVINKKIGAKIAQLSDKEIKEMTIQNLLDQVELSDVHRRALTSRLQGSHCTNLDNVALRSMGIFATRTGRAPYFRINGGNQALAISLAAKLPTVIFNTPVIEVEQHSGGVTVKTNNDKYVGDKVVISAPISVLHKIKFTPELPPDIQHAIAITKLGSAGKLSAVLKDEPPLIAKQETDAPYWCWTGQASDGVNKKAITAFCGSD
ncbi:MAG: FAD-dependent oxidoreductase, partial [Bacteroidetes bacterium]|nr:FAD-dependent oxidoreductase [Bacteroidota bacterium]